MLLLPSLCGTKNTEHEVRSVRVRNNLKTIKPKGIKAMEEWKIRGKDADPLITVGHIKELLDKAGIKTVYKEGEISIDGCCYSRICMDMPYGDLFGSNGKGMTKELCMASAYGEFMERLQNMIFAAAIRNDDPDVACLFPEDAPLYDLHGEYQPECIAKIVKSVAESIKAPSFMMSAEDMAASIFEDLAPEICNGKYPMELYYSVREGKAVYLPTGLLQLYIYSNGMAAGNTYEEALVEGISEIFERYSQIRFYRGGIVPPRIPDEEIDKWPRIRKLINEVEKNGRFTVDLRDCSLGMGLPVVCAIFVDNETGGIGIKFGAQPDMGIAMERTFTEAVQGKTITQASNGNAPTFLTDRPGDRGEKWNTIKVGFGQVPAHLMADTPSYPFTPWKSTEGKNNAELSKEMIELAESIGGDVYIRDNSFLGFPAVCIYIAGVSEAKPVDALTLKELLLQNNVKKMFADLSVLSDNEVRKMLILAKMKSGAVLENSISSISGYRSVLPVKGVGMEAYLLQIACCYCLGSYDGALSVIAMLLATEREINSPSSAMRYINALKLFMEGKKAGVSDDMIKSVLTNNFGKELADRIFYEYADPSLVLSRVFASDTVKKEADEMYNTIKETYKKLGKIKVSHKESAEETENIFKKIGL